MIDIEKFEKLRKISEISVLPSLSPILDLSSAKDSCCQDHSKSIYLMVSVDKSSGRNFMISEFQFNLTAVWKCAN